MSELTQEILKQLLDYNPETGVFTRKVRTSNRIKAGDVAGTPNGKGYLQVRLLGRLHKLHRLAWLYVTGEWPTVMIDHENGTRSDNRFSNLRDATRGENIQNSKIRKDNTSGVKGVTVQRKTGKWIAEIKVNKQRHYLGIFDDLDVAAAVVQSARGRLHGEFTHHG